MFYEAENRLLHLPALASRADVAAHVKRPARRFFACSSCRVLAPQKPPA
jgi:hypothetical protein